MSIPYCDHCHSRADGRTLVAHTDKYSGIVMCFYCRRELGRVQWRPFSAEPGRFTATHQHDHETPPDAGMLSTLTNDDVRRALELLEDLIDECKRSVRITAEKQEMFVSDKIPALNDGLHDLLRGGLPGGLKEGDE